MTQDELERYITRLLPSLRKKHVYTADDDEDCQLALLDLVKRVNQHKITTDLEFKQLFLSYYNHLRYYRRITPKEDPVDIDTLYTGLVENPWTTTQTEAIEYINEISNLHIKDMMTQYFIIGFNIIELAEKYGVSKQRVSQILKQGVNEIKRSIGKQ